MNLRALYPSDNELGIPRLGAVSARPVELVAYNARNRLSNPRLGDCVHFFLDDYRFETMWSQPTRSLSRVARVGMALTPDFSLYPEMPQMVQQWNIYRSRWCGAWMGEGGVTVIPTVTWSDRKSHLYAFLGLDRGTTVAVSTVGIVRGSADERGLFLDGYAAMLDVVRPERVLIYGHRLPGLDVLDSVEQVYYLPRRFS